MICLLNGLDKWTVVLCAAGHSAVRRRKWSGIKYCTWRYNRPWCCISVTVDRCVGVCGFERRSGQRLS